MNNIPQKPYKPLTPFGLFVRHNFPFVEATYEARDNYDLLCKVYQQLKTVEYNQKIGEENIEALYEFLNTLELQDEVNNKLDEMAESGELQEIMASYLDTRAIFCFDNVEDLKNATNLIDGSYAKTLGFHSINDGGSATYKIRNITNDDVIDGMFIISLNADNLIAELIYNNINIKQLGAYGNGENDDTIPLATAIDKCYDVYIPEGEYIITNKISCDKNIYLHGDGRNSILKASNDTILLEFSEDIEKVRIENIQISNEIENRINNSIYIHDIKDLYINNIYFNNIATGGKSELYIKSVITSVIDNSIFNHSSIKVDTWDCKINKTWIWSLSQDYGIYIVGGSGNITLTNCDIVPPLQSNSNYVSHTNMESNWNTAKLQGAIVIGDTRPVVNVKMLGIYIDGNPTLTTGRGIIVNDGCHNILLNNWSANYTDDDLVIIDSSYGITVSNGEITDCYGLDCSLIKVIKTSNQACHTMNISNNTIILKDTTQIPTRKLRSYIEATQSYGGTIEYNKAWHPGSTKFTTKAINVTYDSNMMLYTNRMSDGDFYAEKTGSLSNGATGVTITYSLWGFDYQPSLSNVVFSCDRFVQHRVQFINNNQVYIAFKEALTSDATYDIIVKL